MSSTEATPRRDTAGAGPPPEGWLRMRAVARTLPRYVPGRRAPSDGRAAPRLVRLASNESPFDPLPDVRDALLRADLLARYPDTASTALRERLADRLGVSAEGVAVGGGSVGLLQQIVQTVVSHGDDVVLGWRSFGAYQTLAHVAEAHPVLVPLRDDRLDLDAMAERVSERTSLIFVCTPNNPTGRPVPQAEIERFLRRVPPDVLVVVDEAYREYVRDPDAADGLACLAGHPNVAVLRTFSKAYGLAGLRVGYCVAHPTVAGVLRAVQVPFTVNALGQAAALAALDHPEQLRERVERVVAERTRLLRRLREMGLPVPDSHGNFLWLPTREGTSAITSALERAGVLVRPFGDDGIRVSYNELLNSGKILGQFTHTLIQTYLVVAVVYVVVNTALSRLSRALETRQRRWYGRARAEPAAQEGSRYQAVPG